MRAGDVMSDGVTPVSADATVLEAAKLLINCHVSAMPVVDGSGRMIGIVSEADLVTTKGSDKARLFAMAGTPGSAEGLHHAQTCKVTEVMARNVISAIEDTPLDEISALMAQHRIKRVPILRGGEVVGIVSRVDLLRAMITLGNVQNAPPRLDEPRRNAAPGSVSRLPGSPWSQAKQLDVVVNGGVAHLWGVAPSSVVLKAYRTAAENVPGVKAVEMHMHVVPPGSTRVGLGSR